MAKRKIDKGIFGDYCVCYYSADWDKWYAYRDAYFKTYEEAEEHLQKLIKQDENTLKYLENQTHTVPESYYDGSGKYYGD